MDDEIVEVNDQLVVSPKIMRFWMWVHRQPRRP